MRLRAVVFDLFGTLVPEFPIADWDAMSEGMASALGADHDAFRPAWRETASARLTGGFRDIAQNVVAVCDRIGLAPEPERLEAALEVRRALYRKHFHPQPGAVETLGWLREHGYATALISMCAPDTPPLWHASPLEGLVDVLVFSSETGLRKPEPEIYLLACSRLGVEPSACLYVGDGSFGELSGAAAVGMTPVLIVDPTEGDTVHRPEPDDWHGPPIRSLAEVPALVSG